jgi:hypothetical protein
MVKVIFLLDICWYIYKGNLPRKKKKYEQVSGMCVF